MSHLVVQGLLVPEHINPGYDVSPRAKRCFDFNLSLGHSCPRPSSSSSALPKWLNFKTSNGRTDQTQPTAQTANLAGNSNDRTQQATSRRDSSFSNRSSKSTSSANSLHKKIQEHEMKTKPDEWKKEQGYRKVRRRRNLLAKEKNRILRMIRCLYWPSVMCIGLGTVFIFGSTVRSIGGDTVFWKSKEEFRIVGPIIAIIGVLMLLGTVGLESRSTEKWKKEGVLPVTNPFIHPDFFKKPDEKLFPCAYQAPSRSFLSKLNGDIKRQEKKETVEVKINNKTLLHSSTEHVLDLNGPARYSIDVTSQLPGARAFGSDNDTDDDVFYDDQEFGQEDSKIEIYGKTNGDGTGYSQVPRVEVMECSSAPVLHNTYDVTVIAGPVVPDRPTLFLSHCNLMENIRKITAEDMPLIEKDSILLKKREEEFDTFKGSVLQAHG